MLASRENIRENMTENYEWKSHSPTIYLTTLHILVIQKSCEQPALSGLTL